MKTIKVINKDGVLVVECPAKKKIVFVDHCLARCHKCINADFSEVKCAHSE